ncbi:MAG: Activator of Hsp90 ATPase 1 family protein [Phenylobacterium sp.]|nr:Activator of Hsp90 ATPase 1 family protein [Phenylobacterium sp.]
MKAEGPDRTTRVSRRIAAPREALYAALLDPAALVAWLPPGRMTGQIHAFDARVGGGYRMSLFYPPDETAFRGKSGEREDRVNVRFVSLEPPARIVEAVTFESDDPALQGEMTMIWSFAPAPGGTEVTVLSLDLPPGLRPKDNAEGSRLSLAQLARYCERPAPGAAP